MDRIDSNRKPNDFCYVNNNTMDKIMFALKRNMSIVIIRLSILAVDICLFCQLPIDDCNDPIDSSSSLHRSLAIFHFVFVNNVNIMSVCVWMWMLPADAHLV